MYEIRASFHPNFVKVNDSQAQKLINEQFQQIVALKNIEQELKAQITMGDSDSTKLKSILKFISKHHTGLRNKNQSKESELRKLRLKTIREAEDMKRKLNGEINELKKALGDSKKEVDELKTENNEIKDLLCALQNKLNSTEKDLVNLRIYNISLGNKKWNCASPETLDVKKCKNTPGNPKPTIKDQGVIELSKDEETKSNEFDPNFKNGLSRGQILDNHE